jgi:MFS superfamily sulfate permease-like transporter
VRALVYALLFFIIASMLAVLYVVWVSSPPYRVQPTVYQSISTLIERIVVLVALAGVICFLIGLLLAALDP